MTDTHQPWQGWTPEAIDLLKKLYGEALSYPEIAKRIEVALGGQGKPSRNAVIGIANRLRLPRRPQSPGLSPEMLAAQARRREQRQERKRRQMEGKKPRNNNNPLGWGGAKPKIKKHSIVGGIASSALKPPPLPSEPAVPVVPLRVPLVDLHDNDCHYPSEDRPWTFCGHPALQGEPWCKAHAMICYREPYKRESIARLERIART
jgi:hypothetical protein